MRCSPSGSSCSAKVCSSTTPACCASPWWRSPYPPSRTWFLRTVSTRVQRRFRDKVTIALESHVARLQAVDRDDRAPGAAGVSRPAVGAARPGLRARSHVHVGVLDRRLDPAARRHGGAARVDPSGAGAARRVRDADGAGVLLAAGVERAAQERGAQADRLAQALFTLATSAPPGKEVRVLGIGPRLADRAARRLGAAGTARWRRRGAVIGLARAGLGGLRRSATSARSCSSRRAGRVAAGDVLLVLAAGARLSSYIGATVGEIGFLRGIWMDGSRRLAWLEDYAGVARRATPTCRCPTRSPTASGSSTSSFAYPGTTRLVLDDVDLDPARRRRRRDRRRERRGQDDARQAAGQAVRAERPAGSWSTARTSRACDPQQWRARLAGAFQDFFRFEFQAGQTVGLGDVARMDDEPAVVAAPSTGRAPATSSRACQRASRRSSGRPGPSGVEVSFGQWQKLALARGFMRDEPLLAGARRADGGARRRDRARAVRAVRQPRRTRRKRSGGRITILVSHRFSTVRMADLIVVLDGARVVEVGTHDELMARGGQYAELYGIQARPTSSERPGRLAA